METLTLEKFSPTIAELSKMSDESKSLVIAGIEDHEGYQRVHDARIKLKNTRVGLEKIGKVLRTDALAFQRAVIEKEKELIAIIEPTEQLLESRQKLIDEEKEKAKRKALIPARLEQLNEIEVSVPEDLLLVMNDAQFMEFFNTKKSLFLAEKERKMKEESFRREAELRAESDKIKAEKKKIEDEKLEIEREKKRQEELEQARKESTARTKKEIEAKTKAEAEEKKRIENERIQAEKAEAKRLAKEKKYQEFLKKHGYTEKTKNDFVIQRKNKNEIVLFKKVGEYLDV